MDANKIDTETLFNACFVSTGKIGIFFRFPFYTTLEYRKCSCLTDVSHGLTEILFLLPGFICFCVVRAADLLVVAFIPWILFFAHVFFDKCLERVE